MQQVFHHTATLEGSHFPQASTAGTQVKGKGHARTTIRRKDRSIGISNVWRDTAMTFSAYSGPILLCALLVFIHAVMTGALLKMALTPEAEALSRGICRAYSESLPLFLTPGNEWHRLSGAFCLWDSLKLPVLVAASLSTLVATIAQGAMTWVGLHGTDRVPITVAQVMRATLARWPALVLSALIYSALITL